MCGTFVRNTADASYLLFTREAGMLYADARSVREERSRQRYALQDFSLLRVSLVKGKGGWKIGSIESIRNYYQQANSKSARGSVVSVVRLLRRFLKGEEVMTGLFDLAKDGLETLLKETTERAFIEEVVKLRMLALLGYVDRNKIPAELTGECSNIAAHYDDKLEKAISQLYAHAVDVSHL